MDLSSLWENRVESKRIGMTGQENTGNFKGPQRWATLCGVNMTSGKVSVIESNLSFAANCSLPILPWVKVAQSYPTLCDPMDYSVHGILQARILEWIAFPFSRGSSQPRDWTQVSHVTGRFFTSWATREVNIIGLFDFDLSLYPSQCQ